MILVALNDSYASQELAATFMHIDRRHERCTKLKKPLLLLVSIDPAYAACTHSSQLEVAHRLSYTFPVPFFFFFFFFFFFSVKLAGLFRICKMS
jgi:hypothetical protein